MHCCFFWEAWSQAAERWTCAAGIHPPGSTAHKSEFISRAKRISGGITTTAEKLQRLSQLAKRTSMFDDPAVEINELTSLIKQDIQGLNGALTDLSTFQSRQANGNRQARLPCPGPGVRWCTRLNLLL